MKFSNFDRSVVKLRKQRLQTASASGGLLGPDSLPGLRWLHVITSKVFRNNCIAHVTTA